MSQPLGLFSPICTEPGEHVNRTDGQTKSTNTLKPAGSRPFWMEWPFFCCQLRTWTSDLPAGKKTSGCRAELDRTTSHSSCKTEPSCWRRPRRSPPIRSLPPPLPALLVNVPSWKTAGGGGGVGGILEEAGGVKVLSKRRLLAEGSFFFAAINPPVGVWLSRLVS